MCRTHHKKVKSFKQTPPHSPKGLVSSAFECAPGCVCLCAATLQVFLCCDLEGVLSFMIKFKLFRYDEQHACAGTVHRCGQVEVFIVVVFQSPSTTSASAQDNLAFDFTFKHCHYYSTFFFFFNCCCF